MPVFLNDLTGLGTLISGIAALIAAIYAKSAAKEMKPNHGSSMRDTVNMIDDRVKALGHRQGELHDQLQNLVQSSENEHQRIWQHIDKMED